MSSLGALSRTSAGDAEDPGAQPGHRPDEGGAVTLPLAAFVRPTVSVVVCAFTEERWDDLSRAVSSLHQQTEPAYEIIVVIDHCPALYQRARRELPGVTVVENRFQQGLSGGRNTGVARAQGDVVAFLDDDAAADPDWIAVIADCYIDPSVVGAGGLVRPAWDVGRPSWFPAELDWVVGCSYRGLPGSSAPVRNFIGANMCFRREAIEGAGGFSAALGRVGALPLGCEETELCIRLSQRYPGSALIYEPAAAVSHRVRRHRATWAYLWSRCYAEGRSKAAVASMAGARRALASERSYLRTTIPRGVGRSLAGAARGRLSGLLTAFALVSAVLVTATGYLAGPAAARRPREAGPATASPNDSHALRRAVSPARVAWAGVGVSLTLWAVSLAQLNVASVPTAGLGLIPALPVTFWAAAGTLVLSYCAAVARRAIRWPVMAAHLVALVAVLHATPAIVYGTLRYSWAWKHIGVVDFIIHHGVVFNLGGVLGPYQAWPGFFALNSFLTTGAGQASPLSYASWALPVNDLLWLAAVVLIARAFTSDQRLVWTAAWLFELGNWVGADYFSPQAFAFFLYLTVIAVCLRWLWDPRAAVPQPGVPQLDDVPPAAAGPQLPRSARVLLVACLLPVMAAMASSHQLTPFMLISALTLLAVFRQLRPLVLPLVMAVITAGWILYGALPWLTANSSQVFAGFGLPWANTAAHLVGGAQVPLDQVIVEWGARFLSLILACLAVAGFFRYRRRHGQLARRSWNRTALLAVAAVPSVAANSYGGEIIFRAFLFALPFMAVTAAAVFFPHPRAGRALRTGVALAVVSLVLAASASLANYGQEAINYFTPREVAASQWLYRTAPPGSWVIAANSNYPWAFAHYSDYSYSFLASPPGPGWNVRRDPVNAVRRIMRRHHSPGSYLILTTSQAEMEYLTGTWPRGVFGRVTRDLVASGKFRVVYRNPDALILQLSRVPGYRLTGAGR